MKRILIFAVACTSVAVFAGPPINNLTEGRPFSTNDLPELRKAYPFFDGMPTDVPEGDSRRRDEWEKQPYRITKLNAKGERVLLSKAEITDNRLFARRNSVFGHCTSFGQLVKICDGVFIGEIVEAQFLSAEDEVAVKKGIVVNVGLTFRVETNLFGRIPAISSFAPMMWYGGGNSPDAGKKVMVFYSKGYTWNILDNTQDRGPLGFDWEKPPADPAALPAAPFKNGPCLLFLDTPELSNAYIDVVSQYLQILRQEKRDPDRFYVFLRSLVRSPFLRIRQDAREDMLRLLGPYGPDRFDLKRAQADPELMDFFKDYIRYIAIPQREKSGGHRGSPENKK